MNKLCVSPEAARDLERIRQYIASELKNKASALRVVHSITRELRILQRYPEAGPSLEALTGFPTDLRLLVCGPYVALYRTEGSTVFVSRVLNARQDYLRVLFDDSGEGEAPSGRFE